MCVLWVVGLGWLRFRFSGKFGVERAIEHVWAVRHKVVVFAR